MKRWSAILADDDPDSVCLVSEALVDLDFDVVKTEPTAFLAAAKARKSAVVLLAHSTSVATFGVPMRMLHREPGYFHVIGLLERYEPGAMVAAFAAGADDVIAKPLIGSEVRARLRLARRLLALEDSRSRLEADGTLLAEISTRTSFHSRRYLQAHLVDELARAQRFKHGVAIIVAQLRRHHGNERVMREFGQVLSDVCRARIDWIARYDKQSFALVLPETNLIGALCAAARVQQRCTGGEAAGLPKELTVNVGVCAVDDDRIGSVQGEVSRVLLESTEAYLQDAIHMGPGQIAGGPAPHP